MVKRLATSRFMVLAQVVTVTLALVQIAAGPIYADAVTLAALQRSLVDAPANDTSVTVDIRSSPDRYTEVDAIVGSRLAPVVQSAGSRVVRTASSESFRLGGGDASDDPDGPTELARFEYREGIEAHATLVAGTWPSAAGVPYPVAVDGRAAERLGISVGEVLEVSASRPPALELSIEIVGIFRIDDVDDDYWAGNPLIADGVTESDAFRTHGPFVVTPDALLQGFTRRIDASWRAEPAFSGLDIEGAIELRRRVGRIDDGLRTSLGEIPDLAVGELSDPSVVTGLPPLLAGVDRSLTVTRAGVLAVTAELAIIAGYALVMLAGLVAESRRPETELLASRGASTRQLLALASTEIAILTVPAAFVAPWLAAWLVDGTDGFGPLGSIGLELEPRVSTTSVLAVWGAALLAGLLMAWPALRSARQSIPGGERQERASRRSVVQRGGVDVALVMLAALAWWQLRDLGSRRVAEVDGRLGVDPLVIAGPALGLLAGAIIALRVVPALARLAERVAAKGAGAVPALMSWQLSRRPTRYARSALLLILATGLAFFAAAYTVTWDDAQVDQAAQQVGADLRVEPNRRTNDSISDLQLTAVHEAMDGILESMPVIRGSGPVFGSERTGQFLFLDASLAPTTVDIRNDMAPEFDSLMAQLVAERPTLASIPLPGEPERMSIDVAVTEEEVLDRDGEPLDPAGSVGLTLVLQDGNGLLHRLGLGTAKSAEDPWVFEVDLSVQLDEASAVTPVAPLTLVGIELAVAIPSPPARNLEVELGPLVLTDREGTSTNLPVDADGLVTELAPVFGVIENPVIRRATPDRAGALLYEIGTGAGFNRPPAVFGLRPPGTILPETFPIVVTRAWLEETQNEIGEVVRLPSLQLARDRAHILGVIEGFPTVDPLRTDVFLVDLPTAMIMDTELGRPVETVDEYWLIAPDQRPAGAGLLADPIDSFEVVSQDELLDGMRRDPVALGTVGAFWFGLFAAAVFAVVGFVVNAAVSARERAPEFAMVRALGLSSRQLATLLAAELTVLVVVSLVLGTGLGFVLAAVILPLITVTRTGADPVPELIVRYPWETVAALDAAVVGALAVTVGLVVLTLTRRGVDDLARLGAEQ